MITPSTPNQSITNQNNDRVTKIASQPSTSEPQSPKLIQPAQELYNTDIHNLTSNYDKLTPDPVKIEPS